jgi:Holin of 3TMs, for gene-transfer release
MSALAALALKSGLPLIQSILVRKLGDADGGLAGQVLAAIAERAKVKPEELEALAETDPPKALDAMRKVSDMTPELIALYMKGLEHQNALLMAEQEEGGWKSAWRPAGMWFVMFLWAWQCIILHVFNAIWKIALPPMPWEQLVTFTGLYMGLYMGGHTIKDTVAKVMGAKT